MKTLVNINGSNSNLNNSKNMDNLIISATEPKKVSSLATTVQTVNKNWRETRNAFRTDEVREQRPMVGVMQKALGWVWTPSSLRLAWMSQVAVTFGSACVKVRPSCRANFCWNVQIWAYLLAALLGEELPEINNCDADNENLLSGWMAGKVGGGNSPIHYQASGRIHPRRGKRYGLSDPFVDFPEW